MLAQVQAHPALGHDDAFAARPDAMTAHAPAAALVPLRQDARTISLIGLAHGTSHFFHMLLPPPCP